jgi:IMP dehydrogenase
MYIKDTVTFEDVLLRPRYSSVQSRTEINLSSAMSIKHSLKLPIISSPMDTISEFPMAAAMDLAGGMSIIHRYNSISEQCRHIKQLPAGAMVGAAIGMTGDYVDRACALWDSGCRILCIDVAHGHHELMKHSLKTLRTTFGTEITIIAGNVATKEGFDDLSDWGADAVRVGIGGGSICSTRIKTGHGIPTLQSIIDCSKSDRSTALIADGGIKTSGDIVKALAAGADFVMVGSLLAGTDETPGKAFFDMDTGSRRKVYRGMASKEAQIDWRGHTSSVEGVTSSVPMKGSVSEVLNDLERGVRSGLSYSGARNIRELQAFATFIRQTSAGATESSTHILA